MDDKAIPVSICGESKLFISYFIDPCYFLSLCVSPFLFQKRNNNNQLLRIVSLWLWWMNEWMTVTRSLVYTTTHQLIVISVYTTKKTFFKFHFVMLFRTLFRERICIVTSWSKCWKCPTVVDFHTSIARMIGDSPVFRLAFW